MKVTLTVEYHTRWGESLCLVAQDVKYPMQWAGEGVWSVTLKNATAAMLKDYSYVVMEDGTTLGMPQYAFGIPVLSINACNLPDSGLVVFERPS